VHAAARAVAVGRRAFAILFDSSTKSPTSPLREPLAWLALCAAFGLSSRAEAAFTTTALARFSTDYVYHGYSKSDDHPVAQAHAGLAHSSGVYGGVWMTAIDFGGARSEFIPYIGVQRALGGGFRLDAVVSGYLYEADVFGESADYVETSMSLDWRGLLTARVSAAFDSYGSSHTSAAGEFKARYPLSDIVDVSAGAGFDELGEVTTYDVLYWNAGLSYFIGSHVVADLRYVDSAYFNEVSGPGVIDRFGSAEAGARVVFSISVGF